VVGSALIRLIDRNKDAPDLLERVAEYTRSLKAAL
jgi:tryptophan synthase alpha subunit